MLRHSLLSRPFVTATFSFFLAALAHGELRLPHILGDHLVLQSGQPDAIWGWTQPGATVTVDFLDGSKKSLAQANATAGADGKWMARLTPPAAGTSGTLEIKTNKGDEKIVQDVEVGETWLCTGQSNMQYVIGAPATTPAVGVAVAKNLKIARAEATANHPDIRDFVVAPQEGADTPQDDVPGEWRVIDAENVPKVSAVAWNFGVALREKLHEPIGLVCSSLGSTNVEAWMPKEALESISAGRAALAKSAKWLEKWSPAAEAKNKADIAAWATDNSTPELRKKNAASRPMPMYSPTYRKVPTRLYNGMIAGLEPYTVRGIIWFQSEALAAPLYYGDLITEMVKSWREKWGAELPFYYVEMNNWLEPQSEPVQQKKKDWWPILREQQQEVLQLPKTGVATSIDLGMADEPHFPNKKPVGQRLAGMALADVYKMGDPDKARSPEYSSDDIQGDKVRLHFKYADGLRLMPGVDALKGFAICGADKKWLWADGKIDGTDIVVGNSSIPSPTAVRYGWADNPILSVENGSGLPLRPFRTDEAEGQKADRAEGGP